MTPWSPSWKLFTPDPWPHCSDCCQLGSWTLRCLMLLKPHERPQNIKHFHCPCSALLFHLTLVYPSNCFEVMNLRLIPTLQFWWLSFTLVWFGEFSCHYLCFSCNYDLITMFADCLLMSNLTIGCFSNFYWLKVYPSQIQSLLSQYPPDKIDTGQKRLIVLQGAF